MFCSPAYSHVELEDTYDYGTIDHIEYQSYHLKHEGGLGTACSRHGLEEHLAADIQEI